MAKPNPQGLYQANPNWSNDDAGACLTSLRQQCLSSYQGYPPFKTNHCIAFTAGRMYGSGLCPQVEPFFYNDCLQGSESGMLCPQANYSPLPPN